jgi:L-aminopeptidase/D-esterase-like protein
VLNAVGDVYSLGGDRITGSLDTDGHHPGTPDGLNTTLIAIAIDADVSDRNELRRLAVRAHDGLGSTVRPSHTRYDGDTAFVISTPEIAADIDLIGDAVFDVVTSAILRAVSPGADQ